MSESVQHVKEDEFSKIVLESDLPVVVDFWAAWCMPCKVIEPVVEELAVEYEGKVKFVKVNTDEAQKIAVKYGIMSIPTLKMFKNGEEVNSLSGAAPKDYLKEWINGTLES